MPNPPETLTQRQPTWLASPHPFGLIAGPCSAESPEQVMAVALSLAQQGVRYLRAGVWKPRTRPNSFEGRGEEALPWLAEAQRVTGMEVMVEVANAQHVEAALKAGIHRLWIGARTTVNPFAVQELADALHGVADVPVMVKNPINPDVALWLGAIERLERAGVGPLAACHRGFSTYAKARYRNRPHWQLPLELRQLRPELPLYCDPSHIAGRAELVPEVAQKALDLGYDGLMIEVHPTPHQALSDPSQQLDPEGLAHTLRQLVYRLPNSQDADYCAELEALRAQVDELDHALLTALAQRQDVVRKIGLLKAEQGVRYLQMDRWREVLSSRRQWAEGLGIRPEFTEQLLQLLHIEAIDRQAEAHGPAA